MVNSPCINICRLNTDDICIGCYRTVNEIAKWSSMSDEEKLTVLENIFERQDEANQNK